MIPLFSSPIAIFDIELKNKYIENIKNIEFKSSTDEEDVVEVSCNYNILNENYFCDLKDEIIDKFYVYKNEVFEYTNIDFEITTSWITKTIPGNRGHNHNHKNCMFTSVLYLQSDENCGSIVFENFNSNFLLQSEKTNIFNSNKIEIVPRVGMLIIFPANCIHNFYKNKSRNIRYSLACNYIARGKIGIDDSTLLL